MSKPIFYTEILIPAYSISNDALLISLNLSASPRKNLIIKTQGNIAVALKRSLRRTIEIMAALNSCWELLSSFEYFLTSENTPFVVKDARSAGLPLTIALLNLYRKIHCKASINAFIGTGILRIDGSFESTHKEDIKRQTIIDTHYKQLITSNTCHHVFELDQLMKQYQLQ